MTGGWAATNTLREATWEIAGCGDIRFTHDIERAKREHEDAVALVEAALDAAEQFAAGAEAFDHADQTHGDGPVFERLANGTRWGFTIADVRALAAALRAVREGK